MSPAHPRGRVQAAARNGDSWTETELVLGPQELGCGKAGAQELRLPWRTFPALFAGGGLDIMTTFLLRQLPQPPRKAR